MERFFQILAVILAGVAAYFLWQGNSDGAYVSAVLGAVAFFLSVRFQVKVRNEQREAERLAAERQLEEAAEEQFDYESANGDFDKLPPARTGSVTEWTGETDPAERKEL